MYCRFESCPLLNQKINTMLSIEHSRKRLEKNGKKYTDEQIKAIRDKLYLFAEIQINHSEAGKYNDLNISRNKNDKTK